MSKMESSGAVDKLRQLQIHGLQDILTTKSLKGKALWTIILLGLTCAFAMNVAEVVREFGTNPTSTALNMMNNPHLLLPPIMICPVSALKESALRGKYPNNWERQLKTIESARAAAHPVSAARSVTRSEPSDLEEGQTVAQFEQMMNDLTYDPCELIVGLTFQNAELNCTTDVTKILDREWGMCYRVDSGKAVPNNGASEPLEIWVAIPPVPKHLRKPRATEPLARFLGPQVIVGRTVPKALACRVIQPGSYTQVLVAYRKTVLMPSSTTSCFQNEDVLKIRYPFVKTSPLEIEAIDEYSRLRCMDDLICQLSWEACGCIPIGGSVMYTDWAMNQTTCSMQVIRGCRDKLLDSTDKLKEQAERCKILCTQQDQKIQISQVSLDKFAYKRGRNNLTEDGELAVISIRFSSMLIEELTQTGAVTFPSTVGTFGGVLGLWLGASMFTVIQIMSYVGSLIGLGIRACKSKK